MWRRILAGILGSLAVLAGVTAYGYARMASEDFSDPNVSLWTAILGTGLMWLLTLGAFCLGVHFLKYCFTGTFFRVNRWARALILGALSFFPGFIVSAAPAILVVLKRWPGNVQAENIALLSGVFVGLTLAIVVCVVLLKTEQPSDAGW